MKLDEMKMCIDCNEVFCGSRGICPVCRSDNTWYVIKWLDKEEKKKEKELGVLDH